MKRENFIIAIDGFSSCGKSTVAKAVAKELQFVFIDSGAMYRAVTLYFLRNQVDLGNTKDIENALAHIHIDFLPEADKVRVLLNDEDVSEEIRVMRISEKVSEVSALKAVRQALVKQQQDLGKRRNIVMDGRDIGTTVFPDADLKIFMTASTDVRAERRLTELLLKGESVTIEEVKQNLAHRDYIDSTREESPLRQAEDALVIDNTHLTPAEQLQIVLSEYAKRAGER